MLAWLQLDGFQAYAGAICVGVWKDRTAYWFDAEGACGRGEAVIDHHIDPLTWVRHGSEFWLGDIRDRPIHGLREIYDHLAEKV